MSFFFTKHKYQDVENRRKLKIFQPQYRIILHPFNIFPLQRRVKAKQHITQGNTHRIGRANKQCSEKAKEDNAKQPLHHDLAFISRHVFEQRRAKSQKE